MDEKTGKEQIGSIDMKHVERARKERRFMYVDWKTGAVMLSGVSQGGGKRVSDGEIADRVKFNKSVNEEKKKIRGDISELKKDVISLAKKKDMKGMEKAFEKIENLEKELKSDKYKKKSLPYRK